MEEICTRQEFLKLLRSSLWNLPLTSTDYDGSIDWKSIFFMARQQTVWGLIVNAIDSLPTDRLPSQKDFQQMNFLLSRNRTKHAQLNQTLAEFVTLLRNNDIHPILLKGQGVAIYYKDPTLRICGDIDLYIGIKNYHKACFLAEKWRERNDTNLESDKHYHFINNGVTIELHRFAEILVNSRRNDKFQLWTQQMLRIENCRTVSIGNINIQVPPADFEVLYLFNHIFHHFISGGIGLRQLCDWTLALHYFHSTINKDDLKANLKAFGLWHSWKIFGYIVVNTLGLRESEFPFYDNSHQIQGQKLLEQIYDDGNFGFFNPLRTKRPNGYVTGKWHSFKSMHIRLLHLFSIFPMEIAEKWPNYIFIGITRIIKDVYRKL